MPQTTLTFGIVLVALGLGSYFGTGRESMTAMIPAFFGIVLAALGLLAMKPGLRKHAMHGAAALAVLGVIAPGYRVVKSLTAEGEFTFSTAVAVQGAMALICLVLVVLCVRSFVTAKR